MKITKMCFLLIAFIILLVACTPKVPEDVARMRLKPLLQSCLDTITAGIDTSAILETPRFEIREFRSFDEGQYQYLAVVDFYFLRDIPKKIVRRYRFNRNRLIGWELFGNEWERY